MATRHQDRPTHPWDFTLMMATVVLLGALGLQSFLGTLYAWWAYRTYPDWETSGGHAAFVGVMNAVAAPLVIALVLVMGLCVPKRMFARRTLGAVSVGMLAIGAAAGVALGSLAAGLTAYLAAAALLQVVVVARTVRGAGGLTYLTSGRVATVGSGLLHLGFVGFALVVVALQRSALMLPVFFASAALLVGGSAMSFYARPEPAPAPEAPDATDA